MNTGGSPFVPCGSTSRISKALNATPFYLDAEDIHFHAGLCARGHGVSHLWAIGALASNAWWWQYGILPSRGGPPMHPS